MYTDSRNRRTSRTAVTWGTTEMRGLNEMPPPEFDDNGVVIVNTDFEYRVIITVTSGEKWEGKWTKYQAAKDEEVDIDKVRTEVMQMLAMAEQAVALVVKDGINERLRVFYRNVIAYADIEVTEVYS